MDIQIVKVLHMHTKFEMVKFYPQRLVWIRQLFGFLIVQFTTSLKKSLFKVLQLKRWVTYNYPSEGINHEKVNCHVYYFIGHS